MLDGRQEVIEARFVHPKQALDECREGKVSFMPPQFYLLSTLADILQGSKNTPEQRSQVEKLSNGLFGRMIINPRPIGQDSDGRTILTYEGDETRGGSVGRLHRALLKMQGGVSHSFFYKKKGKKRSRISAVPPVLWVRPVRDWLSMFRHCFDISPCIF